jgi:uncharacterized membrane protein
MSEMLGKMTVFLLIWNFKMLGVLQEPTTKNEFD